MILILQSSKLKLREVIVTCPRSFGPDSTRTTECRLTEVNPWTHTHITYMWTRYWRRSSRGHHHQLNLKLDRSN